jgi:hypothetical protein
MKRIALLTLLGGFAWLIRPGVRAPRRIRIKRRAKETANQNNVRQGCAFARARQPPPRARRPRPRDTGHSERQPAVQSVTNLRADLAGFKTGTVATTEQKQKFLRNLASGRPRDQTRTAHCA